MGGSTAGSPFLTIRCTASRPATDSGNAERTRLGRLRGAGALGGSRHD